MAPVTPLTSTAEAGLEIDWQSVAWREGALVFEAVLGRERQLFRVMTRALFPRERCPRDTLRFNLGALAARLDRAGAEGEDHVRLIG